MLFQTVLLMIFLQYLREMLFNFSYSFTVAIRNDLHINLLEFATFFHNKVKTICDSTAGSEHPSVICPSDCHITALTVSYRPRYLLGSCPSKQCVLDPVPTWLVKSLPNVFTPILTKIINASLASSQFPTAHKRALVTPVLKKPFLDPA